MASKVSRRQFLKMAAFGAGAATLAGLPAAKALAGALPTGDRRTAAQAAEITILTNGWPLRVMPSQEEIEADRALAGYAEALQSWLDKNPGVTFEQVETSIWDAQAIIPAISGGAGATYLFAAAMGNWNLEGARNVFLKGLVADVTEWVEKLGIKNKLTKPMLAAWDPAANVGGRYWNYPIDAGLVGQLIYRRDMVKAAGMKEPAVGWSWEDARATFKALTNEADGTFGLGAPTWFGSYHLDFHGASVLTRFPAPDTPWQERRDYTDPRWAALMKAYREMRFKEKSIFTDVALGGGDDAFRNLFLGGKIGFVRVNIFEVFTAATNPTSFARFAQNLGKPYDEVIGVAPLPAGDGYKTVGLNADGGVSINPNSEKPVIDKALEAFDYMFFGPGVDMMKAATWEATKDLQAVFNYPLRMDGKTTFEGVPGTFEDAWGPKLLAETLAIADLEREPNRAYYWPPQTADAPGDQAFGDAFSRMVTDDSDLDVEALIKAAQETWDAQAANFTSSRTREQYIEGARKYYADLEAYYKRAMPEFYENRYKAYYEKVKAVIG